MMGKTHESGKKNPNIILLSTKHLCCWIPTLLLDKNPQIYKFSAKIKAASRGLYLASSLKDSSDRFTKANNKDSPFIGKLTLQENPSKLMHQQSWRRSRVAQILLTSFCNNYSSNLMAATESPSCSSEKDLHTSNYRPTWLNKTKTCKKPIYRQEEQQNLPVIYLFLMYFPMLVSSLNLPNPHKNRLLPDVKWGLRNFHTVVLQWHNYFKSISCPNWAEHWLKDWSQWAVGMRLPCCTGGRIFVVWIWIKMCYNPPEPWICPVWFPV